MFKEFKDFVAKGPVFAMAVGIIIGAAFGRIVSSLVADIVMPPIGLALGGVDFSNLYINLSGGVYPTLAAAQAAGAATINYGVFIKTIIDFLIIGIALFFMVRALNRLQKPEPEKVPTTKPCGYCAMEIPLQATRCPHCTSELTTAMA